MTKRYIVMRYKAWLGFAPVYLNNLIDNPPQIQPRPYTRWLLLMSVWAHYALRWVATMTALPVPPGFAVWGAKRLDEYLIYESDDEQNVQYRL